MNQYKKNFDEFGNLRENHSPWTLSDLAVTAVAVLCVALMMSGYLPEMLGGWS
jgi:hypothetical protein